MFGYSVDQLFARAPDPAAIAPVPLVSASLTDDRAELGTDLHEMRRMAAMAARRAMEFALGAEQGQVGDETLGYLQDEVQRIAEEYPRVSLSEIWDDLVEAQNQAFRLLEGGRARPSQIRDLNVMATLLSWFMAKGSHDMGDSRAAMMQARAAGVCARQAEHPGLIALVDGLKSLISYWSNKPDDALHYARHGAAQDAELHGTVGVWLPSLEARAAALLGDAEAARAANQRATDLRERVVPDDLDVLGGLLTFPDAKQLYYTVEAEVLLGLGDARITAQAEAAVRGFSDPGAPHWAFGDQAGSQCNLALVRLHAGDLDGAAEALRPVLDLAPALRNNGIVLSAQRVRAALTASPAREAAVARELRTEIEMYQPQRRALPQ
jgi:hypothetical protein